MISKLNITEFGKKLSNNTRKSSLYCRTSILLLSNGKIFMGNFDESSFQITKPYTGYSDRVPFYINGTMRKVDEFHTEIEYELLPIWFDYINIRILYIAMFIGFNTIIFRGSNAIPHYLLFNSCFLLLGRGIFWLQRKSRRQLEKDFLEIFKIDN